MLTRFAGQHLPEAVYARNELEIVHEASGVRVRFDALGAFRAWVLLDPDPVPHLSASAPAPEWDYTFSTDYPGATDTVQAGGGVSRPDGRTFYALDVEEKVVEDGAGPKLQAPTCSCVNGRALVSKEAARGNVRGPTMSRPARAISSSPSLSPSSPSSPSPSSFPPPPPRWKTTEKTFSIEALLSSSSSSPPLFHDTVDLWVGNLDPHSLSTLRVTAVVFADFFVVFLRNFVRVNGVTARVIDTR